ncbi:MAG: putative hemolysin [Sulfitobacter sp.]|jgi:putative hemolysin
MEHPRHIVRDITYAGSAKSRAGRAFIRVTENATGRLSLIKRALGYEDEVAAGRDFWEVIADRYGLTLDIVGGSLENVPTTGPCVLVANHPYGILDGLMMGKILAARRAEYRILANQVFRQATDIEKFILPVSFGETKEATKANLDTRREALRFLSGGGAMGVFPGGTVSTGQRPFSAPMDPFWRSFTAKMIVKSEATVVPVFFEGANSRLFQVASHIHATLRVALLINEFRARTDEPVRVVIGKPIPRAQIDVHSGDARALMDFLRAETYKLSPKPLKNMGYGFECEERFRDRKVR